MSGAQKLEFFFPMMVLGWLTGILLTVLEMLFSNSAWPDRFRDASGFLEFFIAPLVPYFLWRWHSIRNSKERFARHRIFGDTDEFILPA